LLDGTTIRVNSAFHIKKRGKIRPYPTIRPARRTVIIPFRFQSKNGTYQNSLGGEDFQWRKKKLLHNGKKSMPAVGGGTQMPQELSARFRPDLNGQERRGRNGGKRKKGSLNNKREDIVGQ